MVVTTNNRGVRAFAHVLHAGIWRSLCKEEYRMAIYSLDGKQPQLPDGFYYVAESAQVIGNVILQEGVGIWFGAVLRGDNEPITVGTGSNIQENCVLHTDMGYPLVIGQGCTIGHSTILHGCTIGNNSLVGMGATVLNGAQIGENCLIGAGALVTEGKVIPRQFTGDGIARQGGETA
jgi:carbonic anhydrase/acetyltransferase-like protein (isoleucine patch superfamily)